MTSTGLLYVAKDEKLYSLSLNKISVLFCFWSVMEIAVKTVGDISLNGVIRILIAFSSFNF